MKALILVLLLAGCATSQYVWDRPDSATDAQAAQDARECKYDGDKVYLRNLDSPLAAKVLGQATFDNCMASRGYTKRTL